MKKIDDKNRIDNKLNADSSKDNFLAENSLGANLSGENLSGENSLGKNLSGEKSVKQKKSAKKREKQFSPIKNCFKENALVVACFTITGLLFDGLMCLVPIYMGKAITAFANSMPYAEIIKAVLIFLGVCAFVQFNRFFKRYFIRMFANKTVLSMRSAVFYNVLSSNHARMNATKRADTLNKGMSDVVDTVEGVRKVSTEIFDSFVLMIGYFVSLFIMQPLVTLAVLFFTLAAVGLSFLMGKPVSKAYGDYKKETGKARALNVSLIKNNRNLVANGYGDNLYREYEKEQDILEKKSVKSLIYSESLQPLYYLCSLLSIVAAVYFCGKQVISADIEIGVFTAYIQTAAFICVKSGKVAKTVNSFQKARVSYARCKNLLDLKKPRSEVSAEVKNARSNLNINAEVAFGDFKLSAKDIQLEPSLVAVTGKVHGGKSAFISLLTGLYPYEGSVKLCGEELSALAEKNRGGMIAAVFDKPEIFSGTVEENILLGRDGNADELLKLVDLPLKSTDMLDFGGDRLSGGEKGRLMIARAVCSKDKLILIDAMLAGLDTDQAIEILNKIKAYCPESIIMVTVNRLELARVCDFNLCCFDGKVAFLSREDAINVQTENGYYNYDSANESQPKNEIAGNKSIKEKAKNLLKSGMKFLGGKGNNDIVKTDDSNGEEGV